MVKALARVVSNVQVKIDFQDSLICCIFLNIFLNIIAVIAKMEESEVDKRKRVSRVTVCNNNDYNSRIDTKGFSGIFLILTL